MKLDHIAYRVANKEDAIEFITMSLGYIIDPDLCMYIFGVIIG